MVHRARGPAPRGVINKLIKLSRIFFSTAVSVKIHVFQLVCMVFSSVNNMVYCWRDEHGGIRSSSFVELSIKGHGGALGQELTN